VKKLIKILKNKDGVALVMMALMITVFLGFSALAVDVGSVAYTKVRLQNAADAASLAGARDLPNTSVAEGTAMDYAELNGVEHGVEQTVVLPDAGYNGDSKKIRVVCKRTVPYTFAKVLGLTDTVVEASAVAEKIPEWDGEALPFINLDDDYEADPEIVAWEKTGPGDFESLWKDEYHMFNLGKNDDHSKGYFTIDYQDGIMITKGTVATVKQEVGYVYEQNKPVYIFSLSSDVINSGKYNSVKNKDVIPLEDVVLLQVTFDSYDYSGKTLYLTVTEVYDINDGVFPTDYLNNSSNGKSKLVE